MNEQDKWAYINQLDEELLKGGVVLSEWTIFLAKDAEVAFCSGANLSAILACQAAVESHLRFDYFNAIKTKGWGFYKLIEESDLNERLKTELHDLRKYRNHWVHVKDPCNDEDLLIRPEYHEKRLFDEAKKSIRVMLMTLYSRPWI